jgi:hypothetical protein
MSAAADRAVAHFQKNTPQDPNLGKSRGAVPEAFCQAANSLRDQYLRDARRRYQAVCQWENQCVILGQNSCRMLMGRLSASCSLPLLKVYSAKERLPGSQVVEIAVDA